MFALPYIVFLAFTIWSISIATRNPELIVGVIYYCTLKYRPMCVKSNISKVLDC